MKKYINKGLSIKVIILYGISLILAIYTLFTMYKSYIYIASIVESKGLAINEQLVNIITFYMNASMPYIFYTISTWGIGYIIYRLDNIKINDEDNKDRKKQDNINIEVEDDLDLFINEIKNNR